MTQTFPASIATFFAAQNGAAVDVNQYFADDAVVHDEGGVIKGLAAIAEWKSETARKYQPKIEPLGTVEQNGKTVVTSRVSGNFPGSPVELRFAFGLEGGKIQSLEIH